MHLKRAESKWVQNSFLSIINEKTLKSAILLNESNFYCILKNIDEFPERTLSLAQYFSSEVHILNWQTSTDHVLSQILRLKTCRDFSSLSQFFAKTCQVLCQILDENWKDLSWAWTKNWQIVSEVLTQTSRTLNTAQLGNVEELNKGKQFLWNIW